MISKSFLFIISSTFFLACAGEKDNVPACDNKIDLRINQVLDAVEDQAIGSILAEASGGNTPYEFSINDGFFSTANKFERLKAGSYKLTVKDKTGCQQSELVVVKEQLVVSYEAQIVPILQQNCMIAGCHCTGNPLCFATYDQVVSNHLGIRDRTFNRAMPPASSGKLLTDNEIKAISNWVYQGLRNN